MTANNLVPQLSSTVHVATATSFNLCLESGQHKVVISKGSKVYQGGGTRLSAEYDNFTVMVNSIPKYLYQYIWLGLHRSVHTQKHIVTMSVVMPILCIFTHLLPLVSSPPLNSEGEERGRRGGGGHSTSDGDSHSFKLSFALLNVSASSLASADSALLQSATRLRRYSQYTNHIRT